MTPNKLSRAGSSLSCIAYRVFGAIASYTPSHPSYTRIQKDCGLARASVSSGLRELSQYNIIQIQKKGNSGGFANEYSINSPDQWSLPSSPDELVQDMNQFTEQTTSGSNGELVQGVNQFNLRTTPSSPPELEVVHGVNSNNTNIIIPNKKTKTAKADSGGSNGHTPPAPTQVDPPIEVGGFDFEALYQLFPKRGKDMKKSLGMQKCKAQIKTQEQYENLKSAVIHYDEHIKSEKRKRFDYDASFIKTWGHFMSKTYWVDWIKPNGHSSDKEIIVCGKENACSPKEDSIL